MSWLYARAERSCEWSGRADPTDERSRKGATPRSADRSLRPGSAQRTGPERSRERSTNGRPSSRRVGRAASPFARRHPTRVGARSGFEDRPPRLARWIGSSEFDLERFHRPGDPRLEFPEPGADLSEARIRGIGIARGHFPRTRRIICSTWAIGVSGRIPGPRLKTCAFETKPERARSTPAPRAAPPATSASRSRLPCEANVPGNSARAAFGSYEVSKPMQATPRMRANLLSWEPAPRGN